MDAIQAIADVQEIRVRSNLPQEEKISNALIVLLKSEVADGSALAEYKAALDFIVIAWNLSLPTADGQSGMSQIFSGMIEGWDATARREALAYIENLIGKKQALFPRDKRVIVSWEVWFEGGNIRVSAAALVPPP